MKLANASAICSGSEPHGWLISGESSGGLFTFTPSRRLGRGKYLYGALHGRTCGVADDAARDAIYAEALALGYAVAYYRRSGGAWAFISLSLAPRCRQEARRILANNGEAAALRFVAALEHCGQPRRDAYVEQVLTAPCFAKQRAEWLQYIRTQ
jgi:hypothetical protein